MQKEIACHCSEQPVTGTIIDISEFLTFKVDSNGITLGVDSLGLQPRLHDHASPATSDSHTDMNRANAKGQTST